MNESAIVAWMNTVGTHRAGRRQGWILGPCPLAPWDHESGIDTNPSFGVEIKPGESRVYCFACGYGGTQTGIAMELAKRDGNVDLIAACNLVTEAEENGTLELDPGDYESNIFTDHDDHIFPDFMLEALEPAVGCGPPGGGWIRHPYLEGRGVPADVALKLDIRFDAFRQRIVFPVRDFQGRLRGLHGRAVDGGEPKYFVYTFEDRSNPSVWLGEHLLPEDDHIPLVMAESVFDLARVLEVYPHAVSPLKAHPSVHQLRRFDFVKNVITLFDNDKAGAKARERINDAYPGAKVLHVIPETDGGEMSPLELKEALTNTLQFFGSAVV